MTEAAARNAFEKASRTGVRASLRFVTWIWHVRGSLVLAPGQSGDDALDRLDPLFHEAGTIRERSDDTLLFRKKDQAAQDKMSVFDSGVLRIERTNGGPVLRYCLVSRALLFCFLMPLLFLGIAQLTIALNGLEKPAADTAKKHKTDYTALPMHPIDKALGAPAPEKKKKDSDKPGGRDKKPTPTPAYVFAAIFATLYVAGRILEDRLVRTLFRKRLSAA